MSQPSNENLMLRDDPVALTMQLAQINSINPSLVAGAPGEADVASFVAAWCMERGFEVHIEEVAPGRPNVIAIKRGSGGGRSLLFNGHLDTVGASSGETMRVIESGGRLSGRGVLDTKGGLACALVAASRIEPGELAGDLLVAAVADEEYASLGTEALVATWSADAAVILEPTDLAIIPRHKGFAVIEAEFVGRASHTSRPDRGANAVHAAARAVIATAALDAQWVADSHPSADGPRVLASRIDSGGETFTVPARCELIVELRTTAGSVDRQILDVLDAIGISGQDVHVRSRVALSRPPLGVGDDHPLVRAVVDALCENVGGIPVVASAPYWTDAALHHAAGTPAVVFGPKGEGLHEDLEWVSIASLGTCAATLETLARAWCASPVNRGRNNGS